MYSGDPLDAEAPRLVLDLSPDPVRATRPRSAPSAIGLNVFVSR